MRSLRLLPLFIVFAIAAGFTTAVSAQQAEPTRSGTITQEQAEKSKDLHPYKLTAGERFMNKFEDITVNGGLHWHPFLENAYHGGGFAAGVGYMHHVSSYNLLDVRGSYSIRGYERAEVEFMAPRLFDRRANLSVLGGYRKATQIGFFGLGIDSSLDDRANYGFNKTYGSALLKLFPTRRFLMIEGGVELAQWSQKPGKGSYPSVDTVYQPQTLPGLGAEVNYLHTQAALGLDWRPESGYARRGGYYAVTLHDYKDQDDLFGFHRLDYEALQHFPILRESWTISLRAFAQTTATRQGQQVPFFMLPGMGGGDDLRGYSTERFRDRNSLLLQGEWRIMVNRFMDTALFYDAGKVAEHRSDIDPHGMKHDYGFGVRFHSPIATFLRVDVARSSEGTVLVFSGSAPF